jgi:hypothetical protein
VIAGPGGASSSHGFIVQHQRPVANVGFRPAPARRDLDQRRTSGFVVSS